MTEVRNYIVCLTLMSIKHFIKRITDVYRLEKTKHKQISNVVNLFYVELNGMHFVIKCLHGYMCIYTRI